MSGQDQEWSIATGQHEGRPIFIRFREFPDTFPKGDYPERCNVFWTMAEASDRGVPSPDETERMQRFENRLVAALEASDEAVLTVVMTTAGKREFVLQARSECDFQGRVESIPQDADPYPIEIAVFEDAAWEYTGRVTAAV